MSMELVMPSNHLILYQSLLLLPSIFPSIRVLSNELTLYIRWPKYCSFCLRISTSNEYSGLISLRLTGFIFLKSEGFSRVFSNTTVQKHQSSALSFPYGPTLTSTYYYWKKTIALTRGTFVGKVMSLFFNMLSG